MQASSGPFRLTAGLAVALALGGCAYYGQYVPPSQVQPGSLANVDVLMLDGGIYHLADALVTADMIGGTGRECTSDTTSVYFRGDLPLADVALLQVHKKDNLGTLLVTAAALMVLAGVVEDDVDHGTGGVDIDYSTYGGGWGSCPFVYAFDGSDYRLDAEPFVGSICRGLERTTRSVLPSLVAAGGCLSLAFCDQAPESHFINSLRLYAVDHAAGSDVVVDVDGESHETTAPVAPVRALDFRGRDALALVAPADGHMWMSDLAAVDPAAEATLRDGFVCEFTRPADSQRGLLVLRVVNTDLAEFGVHTLLSLCGPAQLAWIHELNTRPAVRDALAGWMLREGSLRVEVFTGEAWRVAAAVPTVGGTVPVTVGVVCDLADVTTSTLQVRLDGASGLWRVDRVAVDYGAAPATELIPLPLESLRARSKAPAIEAIMADDGDYLSLLPGDWAVATFACPASAAVGRYSYVLQAGGHYYPCVAAGPDDQRAVVQRVLREPLYGNKRVFAQWRAQTREVVPPVAPQALPRPVLLP